MLDFFEDQNHFYLVLELCDEDLFDWLSARKFQTSTETKMSFFKSLAEGLDYLHTMGIIHRDLKLENIMITDIDSEIPTIKIADFGLSKLIEEGRSAKDQVGTLLYVAPEILKK